jgi:trimethylamine---corrinoid protein Co-methyltransferase
MIQRYFEQPIWASTEDDIAIETIREVGPGGHYFGCQHTQDRYQTAFYQPFVSDWRNYEAWEADGATWTPERAHRIYKQILAEFEAPEMNGDHREELARFVAKRKQEGGAPTDF